MAIGNLQIENYVPVVKLNKGLYTELPIETTSDLIVAGDLVVDDITMDALTVTGNTVLGDAVSDTLTVTGATTIQTTAAAGLAVGATAAGVNPAFVVNASTASQAAGLSITGAVAAGTVAVAVLSSGTDASVTLNAKGTGTIGIGSVSTGAVTITPATTITGLATLTGGFTSAANAILKSGTAAPATAGAVAAGAPISLYSGLVTIEVTTDAPTHIRPKGSICINTAGSSSSTRLFINSDGSTGWVAITTAT
jgi:hypothetical protein